MHNIDRRQLLKTTGVGAGIALGAGTTSMGGVAASTSSDSLSADTVETITTTSQSGSVAISEETTADFRQEAYAVSGDAITLQGEVDSTAGTWTSTNVDFGDVASLVESLDLQAVVSDVLAKLDLENSVDNLLLDDLLDDIITILDAPDWTQTQLNGLEVLITELIAEYAGVDPTETFVYSGTDDSEFASNQHQGLTLDDEAFVWECQQLLRGGSFDIVFYFEASTDTEGLLSAVRAGGYKATGVRGDTDSPADAVID